MKKFNLKHNRVLFIETIVAVTVIIIIISTILYSIFFDVFNDIRRQNYDEHYLSEIYREEKDNLNKLVSLIQQNDIETISHGITIDRTQNYYYLASLYYQTDTNLSETELNCISAYAYNIFDKYDFDEIKNDNDSVTFTFFSANIELVYGNLYDPFSSNEDDIKINDNWSILKFD